MRRLMPWVLVSLVALGAGAGAALGIAHGTAPSPRRNGWRPCSPRPNVQAPRDSRTPMSPRVPTPTSEARSRAMARSTSSPTTRRSPRWIIRSVSARRTTSHCTRCTRRTHVKAIVIGGTVYQANPIPGIGITAQYHVLPFPKLPRAQRGLALALNADVALDSLRGPNALASVRNLGPANIDGAATTRYEVTFAPLRVCVPHQPPAVLTQRPSDVWVDGAGRLLQVRSTSSVNGRPPRGEKLPAAFGDFPRAPATTVATFTFSAFGSPVHVVAPPASALAPRGGSSVGLAISLAPSCRS